jgi:membrane-bound lytic murein transglycosylase F
MMLTLDTAGQLDVDNRLDPDQSILGGARYFRLVKEKIPDRIPEPDRTWLALAAYNVGFGHLEDARKLTQKLGGDPDKWVDVKKTLPLLSQKKYYSQTQFGYARGQEPVTYVENIRSYYDLLVWTDEQDKRHNIQPPTDFITLDSPVL